MDDVDVLAGVMTKAGALVAGVEPDQWDRPTPCPDWDVRALVEHMVGWVQVFEAAANGRTYDGDPSSYRLTGDPAEQFRASAENLVSGWRAGGVDRAVRLTSGEVPARMVLNMTLMEYVTHGWDLATATGQRIPFTDDEAEQTLALARATLRPEFRGPDRSIGNAVDVPGDVPALARLVAFMGRTP